MLEIQNSPDKRGLTNSSSSRNTEELINELHSVNTEPELDQIDIRKTSKQEFHQVLKMEDLKEPENGNMHIEVNPSEANPDDQIKQILSTPTARSLEMSNADIKSEKSSPIREFLNEQASARFNEDSPTIVLPTEIFDMGSRTQSFVFNTRNGNTIQSPTSVALKDKFNQSKILLKYFRLLRLHAKQEVFKKKKDQMIQLESLRDIHQQIQEEEMLQDEMNNEVGMIEKTAIAMNHHQEILQRQVLKAWSQISEYMAERRGDLSATLALKKEESVKRNVYDLWLAVLNSSKKERTLSVALRINFVIRKKQKIFLVLKCLQMKTADKLNQSLELFRNQLKQKVFDQFKQIHTIGLMNQIKSDNHLEQNRTRFLKHLTLLSLVKETFEATGGEVHEYHVKTLAHMHLQRTQAIFEAWRKVTRENGSTRNKVRRVQKKHSKQLKKQCLKDWLMLWKESRLGRAIHGKLTMQKVFKGLKIRQEMRQKKQVLQDVLQGHLQRLLKKNVFRALKKVGKREAEKRVYESKMINHMTRYKMRKVLQMLFNQIDLFKKWRLVNENTQYWYAKKWARKIIKGWRSVTSLKLKEEAVASLRMWLGVKFAFKQLKRRAMAKINQKKLAKIHAVKLKGQIAIAWYSLLSGKLRGHLRLAKRRHFSMLAIAFDAIVQQTNRRLKFKKGMKRLLERRANNLLRYTLTFGLKRYWRQVKMHNNLRKASSLMNRLRIQRTAFRSILRYIQVNVYFVRQLVRAKPKHSENVHFTAWLRLLQNKWASEKFFENKQRMLLHKVMDSMKEQLLIADMDKNRAYIALKKNQRTKLYLNEMQKACQRIIFLRNSESKISQQAILNTKRRIINSIQFYGGMMKVKKLNVKLVANHYFKINAKALFKALRDNRKRNIILKNLIKSKDRTQKGEAFSNLCVNKALQNLKTAYLASLKKKMKQKIVNFMKLYTLEQMQKKQMVLQATLFDKQRLSQKVLKAFRKSIVLKTLFNTQKKASRVNTCVQTLRAWRQCLQEAIEEGQDRHLALELYTRHMFRRLWIATQIDRPNRRAKAITYRHIAAFWERNSKIRAIRKLLFLAQVNQEIRLKVEFARRQWKRKVYAAWFEITGRMKRKRLILDGAQIQKKNWLMEQSFKALHDYSFIRIQRRLIVNRFRERSQLVMKADCLTVLHRNIRQSIDQKSIFYAKTVQLAQKRMAEPFANWVREVIAQRQAAKADKYQMFRIARRLKKTALDQLRINCLKQNQKQIKNRQLLELHEVNVMRRVIGAFRLEVYEGKKLRDCEDILLESKVKSRLGQYFQGFKDVCLIAQEKRLKNDKAYLYFRSSNLKKCFKALIYERISSKQGKIAICLHDETLKKRFLRDWYRKMLIKMKLGKMVNALQVEHDSRSIHKFFPKLVKETYILQIFDHMHLRRVQNYQIEFINQVRKQILLKKIQRSFKIRSQLELKRSILVELRLHAFQQNHAKEMLVERGEDIEMQTELQHMQTAFNILRERVVMKKFKKIASNCHKLRTKKKVFMILQEKYLRKELLNRKAEQIKMMQAARYLWEWHEAHLKESEKNQAGHFIKSTQLWQIVQAWREITHKSKKAQLFNKLVTQKSTLKRLFHGWTIATKLIQRDKELSNFLRIGDEQQILVKYFTEWQEAKRRETLIKKMQTKINLRVYEEIYSAWQYVRAYKNTQRQNLFHIKMELMKKPMLARPLIVMNNRWVFRAFNKLKHGCRKIASDEEKYQAALFAYYMKVQKKAFFQLKLGAQLSIQRNQTEEIADLFIKRRFFKIILDGVLIKKIDKRLRNKANIFRYLSLQKKVIQSLEKNRYMIEESRIKTDCALRLYFKNTVFKTFSILKAYQIQKKMRRIQREFERDNATSPNIMSNAVHTGLMQDNNSAIQSRQSELLNDDRQFGSTSLYPSVGAINNLQQTSGADHNQNIFNNLSYASNASLSRKDSRAKEETGTMAHGNVDMSSYMNICTEEPSVASHNQPYIRDESYTIRQRLIQTTPPSEAEEVLENERMSQKVKQGDEVTLGGL